MQTGSSQYQPDFAGAICFVYRDATRMDTYLRKWIQKNAHMVCIPLVRFVELHVSINMRCLIHKESTEMLHGYRFCMFCVVQERTLRQKDCGGRWWTQVFGLALAATPTSTPRWPH